MPSFSAKYTLYQNGAFQSCDQDPGSEKHHKKETALLLLSQAMKQDLTATIRKVAVYLRSNIDFLNEALG